MNEAMKPLTMEYLFKRAEELGLWFSCAYQGLIFSPTELRRHQADGRFRWGAVNWELIDPKEELARLVKNAVNAQAAVESFKKRMNDQ